MGGNFPELNSHLGAELSLGKVFSNFQLTVSSNALFYAIEIWKMIFGSIFEIQIGYVWVLRKEDDTFYMHANYFQSVHNSSASVMTEYESFFSTSSSIIYNIYYIYSNTNTLTQASTHRDTQTHASTHTRTHIRLGQVRISQLFFMDYPGRPLPMISGLILLEWEVSVPVFCLTALSSGKGGN